MWLYGYYVAFGNNQTSTRTHRQRYAAQHTRQTDEHQDEQHNEIHTHTEDTHTERTPTHGGLTDGKCEDLK